MPLPGHYASVLRVAPNLGIALATDSVGSKVIVAEQAGRFDTIGIDCVAMNVNDLICVGAEPLALLDYLAVESADPGAAARARDRPEGRRRGGRGRDPRRRGLPAARGDPRPSLALRLRSRRLGVRHGRAGRDRRRLATVAPGDALIGLPASGVHSNGLTLARRALLERGRPRARRHARRARRRQRRRRPARADGDLRAGGPRPAAQRHPGPRPGPHHRRRAGQPAAARRRRSASRSPPRSRCRRCSA